MLDGRVAAVGTPADIIDERVLSGIYDMDLAVREVEGQRLALYYA